MNHSLIIRARVTWNRMQFLMRQMNPRQVLALGSTASLIGGASAGWRFQSWTIGIGVAVIIAASLLLFRFFDRLIVIVRRLIRRKPIAQERDALQRATGRSDAYVQWGLMRDQLRRQGVRLDQLPRVLLIGPSMGGKSELCRAYANMAICSGREGDPTVFADIHVSNQAVWVDVAGRLCMTYGTLVGENEDDPDNRITSLDREGWSALLDLMQNARPDVPFDAMVLCVSSVLMLCGNDAVWDNVVRNMRESVMEVTRRLGERVPVYVVITKADRILGMRELVDLLTPDEAGQMFGWSRLAQLEDDWREGVVADEGQRIADHVVHLSATVRSQVMSRSFRALRGTVEEEAAQREALLQLPAQFDAMRERIADLVTRVFQKGVVDCSFLRGVYLTAARTEGSVLRAIPREAFDGATDTVLADLEGDRSDARKGLGTKCFIDALFNDKIQREIGMSRPTSLREDVNRRMIRWGQSVAAGLALVVMIMLAAQIVQRSDRVTEVASAAATVAAYRPDERGQVPDIEKVLHLLRYTRVLAEYVKSSGENRLSPNSLPSHPFVRPIVRRQYNAALDALDQYLRDFLDYRLMHSINELSIDAWERESAGKAADGNAAERVTASYVLLHRLFGGEMSSQWTGAHEAWLRRTFDEKGKGLTGEARKEFEKNMELLASITVRMYGPLDASNSADRIRHLLSRNIESGQPYVTHSRSNMSTDVTDRMADRRDEQINIVVRGLSGLFASTNRADIESAFHSIGLFSVEESIVSDILALNMLRDLKGRMENIDKHWGDVSDSASIRWNAVQSELNELCERNDAFRSLVDGKNKPDTELIRDELRAALYGSDDRAGPFQGFVGSSWGVLNRDSVGTDLASDIAVRWKEMSEDEIQFDIAKSVQDRLAISSLVDEMVRLTEPGAPPTNDSDLIRAFDGSGMLLKRDSATHVEAWASQLVHGETQFKGEQVVRRAIIRAVVQKIFKEDASSSSQALVVPGLVAAASDRENLPTQAMWAANLNQVKSDIDAIRIALGGWFGQSTDRRDVAKFAGWWVRVDAQATQEWQHIGTNGYWPWIHALPIDDDLRAVHAGQWPALGDAVTEEALGDVTTVIHHLASGSSNNPGADGAFRVSASTFPTLLNSLKGVQSVSASSDRGVLGRIIGEGIGRREVLANALVEAVHRSSDGAPSWWLEPDAGSEAAKWESVLRAPTVAERWGAIFGASSESDSSAIVESSARVQAWAKAAGIQWVIRFDSSLGQKGIFGMPNPRYRVGDETRWERLHVEAAASGLDQLRKRIAGIQVQVNGETELEPVGSWYAVDASGGSVGDGIAAFDVADGAGGGEPIFRLERAVRLKNGEERLIRLTIERQVSSDQMAGGRP